MLISDWSSDVCSSDLIVVRLLHANRVGATILDHDPEIIDALRKFGFKVFYGDATRLDLLEAAGAARAKILVVAVDNTESSLELVDLAKQHFPNLKIRSEEHTSELQSLMRISYAVFCLKKKNKHKQ